MKRAFLIVTHGDMGKGLVSSLEILLGPQENVTSLGLYAGDSIENLRDQVLDIIDKNMEQYDETIILVDLLGGSPSNVSMMGLARYRELKIITGVNLPLLINLLNFSATEESTDKLIQESLKVANDGMKLIDKNFLKKGE